MRTGLVWGLAILWLTVQAASAQVVRPLAGMPPAIEGALGPGCPVLEKGEFVLFFSLPVEAGKTYVLRVQSEGFPARLLAGYRGGDDVVEAAAKQAGGPATLTFKAPRDGHLLIAVTSLAAGQQGPFRLEASLPATPTKTTAPAQPTTPTKPATTTSKPQDPRVPPALKFEGAKTVDLKQLPPLTPPKPNPATVGDPGVLAKTLHQMNYLCVTAGGWSQVNETNWLYPRAGDTTHSSPRNFHPSADNQFFDRDEAKYYTVPLQWTGNVFTCSHRRNLDDRGNLEMLDVTGTVSPNGDRVQWVTVREYVQEAYWDEKTKQALLSRRLWQSFTLVDLPLRNLYYRAESDDLSKRFITMQERLKMVSPGLMTERMLNEGFHYGYSSARDAGSHVLDLTYLEQDPAVRNAPYIDAEKIHTVEYRSTSWAHEGGGDARLSFERRNNARPD